MHLLILLFALLFPVTVCAQSGQMVIMGWVETVAIDALDVELKAKLDTGAKTSSMRAEVVKIIEAEKEGEKRRIVFKLEGQDGKTVTLERKLVRWVRIKSRSGKTHYRRPVVEMDFCIAGRRVHSEVNLAARKEFIYPILVGRNMLDHGNILVDSSKTFTAEPHCPATEKREE
jgi:hypothetical protein